MKKKIKGDFEKTVRFMESLKLCLLAASLNGIETPTAQPATSSHYFITLNNAKNSAYQTSLYACPRDRGRRRHNRRPKTSLRQI